MIIMCKLRKGTLCKLSDKESQIYAGSGYCTRCKSFNGVCSTDKEYISCLNYKNGANS